MSYIHTDPEVGRAFFQQGLKGSIVMLNLLKFHETADYSANPELAPEGEISGLQAYKRYMAAVEPLLKEVGGEVLYFGSTANFLIGPQEEKWDWILLVRHASAEKFLGFATNDAYKKIAGHRTAALADSRLLPTQEFER